MFITTHERNIKMTQTTLEKFGIKEGLSTQVVIKSLAWSLFIGICAQIAVPFWPVPMTMQPFAILLIGYTATPEVALGATIAYLVEGSVGLPVFSDMSAGLAVLAGPTGGYLVGFMGAAYVMSLVREKASSTIELFFVGLLGQAVIYIFGIAWLSMHIGFSKAITFGLLPFALKIPFSVLFALLSKDLTNTLFKRFSK
jgi:biotin transport system substrate-specific component